MKNQVNQFVWKLTPVRVSSYPVQQKSVVCVLYRVRYRKCGRDQERQEDACVPPPSYAIGIDNGEDRELCLVGNDRRSATVLYRRLVKMTVTPCTLSDIVTDYLEEAQGEAQKEAQEEAQEEGSADSQRQPSTDVAVK
jgi:hypothetical protein